MYLLVQMEPVTLPPVKLQAKPVFTYTWTADMKVCYRKSPEKRCKNHKDHRCAENTEIKEKSEIFPETGFKTSNKQRKNHLQIQLLQGGKGRFQGQNYCKEKRNSRNYGESREENS